MPQYVVRPSKVTSDMLIDFTIFPKVEANISNTLIPLSDLETSDLLINFALRQTPYIPYKNKNKKTKQLQIGYGLTEKLNNPVALEESEAYGYWIDNFKNKERAFKKFFPLDTLTQTQYDAMVSLYFFTGAWDKVGSEIVKFDLKPYILERNWDYVATALINNGKDRLRTQSEAKIMMLGNYGRHTPRSMLQSKGINLIRGEYPRQKDPIAKQQCEYIYYVDQRKFLPGLTQSRMRQIVDLYNLRNQ
jgi:hypothetical protein